MYALKNVEHQPHPPQAHLTAQNFLYNLIWWFCSFDQKRIFSHTLKHKWTRLIDFLSSQIALIAANMADKSSWLCVLWDKVERQTGSWGCACHSRGPGFITPAKSPLVWHNPNPDPHPMLSILYLPPNKTESFLIIYRYHALIMDQSVWMVFKHNEGGCSKRPGKIDRDLCHYALSKDELWWQQYW